MKNEYCVFIDETGSFSYRSKAEDSYIAGWVCSKKCINQLAGELKSIVKDFNNTIPINNIVKFPNHLHFAPLHFIDARKDQDSDIQIDLEFVPKLINKIFGHIQNKTDLVFYSSGRPSFNFHEQATYMDILRNTLVQLLDEPFFDKCGKISVTIGHRRHKVLYGIEGYNNLIKYEKFITEEIEKELRQVLGDKKQPVDINFGDARTEAGLILADFFCGALKHQYNYLDDFDKKIIKKYPFHNGYLKVGNHVVQAIRYVQEKDAILAALMCIEVLSVNPSHLETKNIYKNLIKGMSDSDKRLFYTSINEHIYSEIVESPDRYENLDTIEKLLLFLRNYLPIDFNVMTQSELWLMAKIQLYELTVKSHRGVVDKNILSANLSFLDNFGGRAFLNQMDIMQQRIDTVLIGAQVSAFNALSFDDVEPILKDARDRYVAMFKSEFSNEGIKDFNLARLEGTFGQVCAFIYDMPAGQFKDEDYFLLAEGSLIKDIKACIPNTPGWEQGMGYLTVLYWKSGDLTRGITQFLLESEAKNVPAAQIFDLECDPFSSYKKPFLLLHRLCICALASREGNQINNLSKAKMFLNDSKLSNKYPQILSAKWLAIIYMMKDDFDPALELLDAALKNNNEAGFTIEVVKLPIKMCRHLCQIKLGQQSDFNLQKEIDRLDVVHEGAKDILKQIGIDKFLCDHSKWDVYNIGTMLPFYLS